MNPLVFLVHVAPTIPTGPLVPKAYQNPDPVPGGLFDRQQPDDLAQLDLMARPVQS